jgi:hypothetical protein
MFSAQRVALNVTTASVQLRVLPNSVYLSARIKLRGTNSTGHRGFFFFFFFFFFFLWEAD